MFDSKDLNDDATSSYVNIRIVDEVKQAVKHAVDSIENQHNLLISVLLSVLLGIVCGEVAEEIFRHGTLIFTTLLIGSLLIIGFYILFRGGYDATFMLVFDASNLPKDWRSILKNTITGAELEQRAKLYGIRNADCRDVVSRGGDVRLICNYKYRGSIPLEIELYLFRAGNVIPLTVTLKANPFKVAMEELCNALLLNKLRAWKRKDYYVELNILYTTIEDLIFYFDDLVKVFSEKGIIILDVIY
jgi:hypothetical protein